MSPAPPDGIGCRGVALTAITLAAVAIILWTGGFLLSESSSCTGACEWGSFTLLFAGGPVSALITVAGGSDLVVGWPVDLIAWLMIGVLHQRLSGEAQPGTAAWGRWIGVVLAVALVYGGALALLVDRVR